MAKIARGDTAFFRFENRRCLFLISLRLCSIIRRIPDSRSDGQCLSRLPMSNPVWITGALCVINRRKRVLVDGLFAAPKTTCAMSNLPSPIFRFLFLLSLALSLKYSFVPVMLALNSRAFSTTVPTRAATSLATTVYVFTLPGIRRSSESTLPFFPPEVTLVLVALVPPFLFVVHPVNRTGF